jgi:hypothetical protein
MGRSRLVRVAIVMSVVVVLTVMVIVVVRAQCEAGHTLVEAGRGDEPLARDESRERG